MTSMYRPRTIATVGIGVAAIGVAVAGCTPKFAASSDPVVLPTITAPVAPAPTTTDPTTAAPTTAAPTTAAPTTAAPTTAAPTWPTPTTAAPTTAAPTTAAPTTAAPTTAAPTTAAPTTAPPAAACTTSTAKGSCGPYGSYAQIQGSPSQVTVGQDVWNPISGWQQTLSANSPGDWSVTANMPAGNTAVVSFPNTGANYDNPAVSSFSSITSSFTESMGSNSATNAHNGYDLWFNNWNNEVMIQTDFAPSGERCGSYEASASFGGSNGVPVQTWSLCQFGSELIWQLATNESSGTVDIKSMVTWLENKNYLPGNSTVTALSFGFEISSTGGKNVTFNVSNFSINT